MQLGFSLVKDIPEFSANRNLPQQRYILHCLRTLSFRAQWKTKIRNPERKRTRKKRPLFHQALKVIALLHLKNIILTVYY